ncbi:type II CRISPR-associated endonuclease Cas1 [Woodsholea maritima]|uniref:type II CRISPR-associated endonuclease Cas1 n=1 Tax=Woodsholea maritima TaxID=240237 RepID=UPI0003619817|nr:type II CRISPR-associated endonuclease Cas1 [Woodsholea maritima]
MDRIVDITTEGLHLNVYRGFLIISQEKHEQGRIPLDDIGALIVHAHGTTWSTSVFVRMAERAIPVVLCGPNHAPVSVVWPFEGHHLQGARLRAQAEAAKPLKKQLWQRIVAAKIRMQGHVLNANGKDGKGFNLLARKVRSGDPDNVEAQAARRYWKALMGAEFSRDQSTPGVNALLNYGYTVLRAVVSRAICASGLHPTLGIFHSNRANAFALSDDLMEPYRPLVDQIVFNCLQEAQTELAPTTKFALTSLTTFDLDSGIGLSPVAVQVARFVHSLAMSFESGKPQLEIFKPPSPLELASLGRAALEGEV